MATSPLDARVDPNKDGIALTGASDTIPKEMLDNAPDIDRLRRRFDEARTDANESRTKANKDRDYYDGPKQLDSDIRTILKNRGQPPIYTNRVRPAVNGVLGVLESSRMDPRAYPRNPDDEGSADVASKTLRYIADDCHFQDTQQDVAENFLIEGTGAVLVEMEGQKIIATQIRWEEFYFDPYSRRADFKDARYMGVAKWKDAAEVRQKWNVRVNEIGDPLAATNVTGTTWEDRPETGLGWVDRKRRRVMLVEEYAIEEGQWMRLVYIGTGVLEYGVSPWLDEKGQPCNPIEAVSCYVDRENNRYGMVRDMIPIQDEVNASRSRSLHLMNSRQIQQTDPLAAPVDADTARQEAAKADGIIPAGWQMVPTSDMAQANILRNQEAKSEIERMGPTPAIIGRQETSGASGRARLVSQQAGLTELARPMGRLNGWGLRVYRQFWNRARQFWNDPMWIRVTDNIRAPEFLKVNEPIMGPVMQPAAGPDGQPQIDPATGQPQMMPGIGVVGMKNRLAEMDMDIILEMTPDTANLQQEVFSDLKELVASGIDVFDPRFELMIEMSPLEDKQRILEVLGKKRAEAQQAQAPAQEEQHQLATAAAIADIKDKEAQAEERSARAASLHVDSITKGFTTGLESVPEPQSPQNAA
jgi:hypothetical protein